MKELTAILAILSASPAFARDETVGVRVREWFVTMEGDIKSDATLIEGTDIDLDSTLGLDDREVAHEIQAYVAIPFLGKIYAGAWWATFEGDQVLSQSIDFAGQTFAASTTISSTIDLNCYYLSYEFVFPTIPLGDLFKAEIGILAGIRVIQASGEVEAIGLSAGEEGTVGIPVLGLHGMVQVTEWVRADVELMGLTFSYGDRSGRYVEAFGEVIAQPFPWLFGGVGYKFVDLRVKDEASSTNFDIDINLTGFYLTAGVRF